MAKACCLGSGGHASHTAAHHGDAFGNIGSGIVKFGFMPGTRINQTPRDPFGKDIIQTSLIAGNAGVDLVGPALTGFAHEIRVCQHRARHRYQIRITAGDNTFGQIRRVNPIRGHNRN